MSYDDGRGTPSGVAGATSADARPHDQAEQPQDHYMQQDALVDSSLVDDQAEAGKAKASHAKPQRVKMDHVAQKAGDGDEGDEVEYPSESKEELVQGLRELAPGHEGAERGAGLKILAGGDRILNIRRDMNGELIPVES